jgi:hypothetical protein
MKALMRLEPKPATPMQQKWWWFDNVNDGEKSEAALAWETLRRTTSYGALWRKRARVAVKPSNEHTQPSRALSLQAMQFFQRSRQAIGQPYFDFLMHNYNPTLSWLQLPLEQRLTAKGYVVGEQIALKAARELVLPRQTSAAAFAASIRLCEISRNSAKQFFVSKLIHGGEDLKQVTPSKFFQKLRLRKTPAQYLYVYFDTRLGREPVLAAIKAEQQFWTTDPAAGSTRLKKDQVWVIPSNEPPFAIFLAPASCDKERLLAALHTQLKAPQRQEWFPRCVDHWKTCTVADTELVRKPDGTIQADSRGLPLRRRVIRPLFDPEKHSPSKETPHKSATRTNLLLGLAANDVVRQKHSLSKTNPDVIYLQKQTESWASETSTKMPSWHRLRKSLSELRNHQRSAKRRLMELDTQMGRLDKKLDRCIEQSTELAQRGFFRTAGPHG